MAPTASMVTIDEPLIAAKAAHDSTQATASPPGIGAVKADMKLISRLAMEPRDITLPASMNSGTDSSTSRSTVNQKSWIRNSILLLATNTCKYAVTTASTRLWRSTSSRITSASRPSHTMSVAPGAEAAPATHKTHTSSDRRGSALAGPPAVPC